MASAEEAARDYSYDRSRFVAFRHYYIPANDNAPHGYVEPVLELTPPAFRNLAEAFKKNIIAVVSTACMPFRIASANHSNRLFMQLFMAEKIRALKPEYRDKSEEERLAMAREIASRRFSEAMSSEEERYQGGLAILGDLENLLCDPEMNLAAAELMRQAEVLAWGTVEVLANDLLIDLLNKKPNMTEGLLKDERTRKRFQLKDISSALSSYGYDLSGHMGDVVASITKIDDVETLRSIYDVLMPANDRLLGLLRGAELWRLNQRRNVILHRRSIVDEMYLRNTGDSVTLGSELNIAPEQFEKDLSLVVQIGSAMLAGLEAVA